MSEFVRRAGPELERYRPGFDPDEPESTDEWYIPVGHRYLSMSLVSAIVIFVVGLISGVIVRSVAGLAAVIALILVIFGIAVPEIGLIDFVIIEYYQGNELLFLAGLLFGIDAVKTREYVSER